MSLPKPKGKKHLKSGPHGLPEPTSTGGDFDPFINAKHVGKLGTVATLKISGEPEARETEFSDVQLGVTFKNEQYSFGLKSDKPNYARLFERFGDNPKKWVGKSFKVEVKRHMRKDYLAIV